MTIKALKPQNTKLPPYWDLAGRRIRGWSYVKGLPIELNVNDDGCGAASWKPGSNPMVHIYGYGIEKVTCVSTKPNNAKLTNDRPTWKPNASWPKRWQN